MEQTNSVVAVKSYSFAVRIVNAYKYLVDSRREHVLSKQLLRSGTAIGALNREAVHAQSRADFLNKMNVALKEAYETEYWLQLLFDTRYLEESVYLSIMSDCQELVALHTAIVKSVKNSLQSDKK